jgi:protein-S-isoprenylcysteine O-methyltransferase Ste14
MSLSSALDARVPDLRQTQRKRKLAAWFAVAASSVVLAGVRPIWSPAVPGAFALITTLGIVLIVVCILGRTWCTIYIGGHKKRQLTTQGPYSVVRNPLYVFTIIGTAGIGAQSGTVSVTVLFTMIAAIMFAFVVRREERFLAATFGAEFAAYCARVPRFWPRPTLWQEAGVLLVSPHLVRRSFLDACLFLLAVPIAQLVHEMHDDGWFPLHLRLP